MRLLQTAQLDAGRQQGKAAQDASAGYAQRYWARTTASFQHRVWYSVSQSGHATHSNVLVAGVAGLVAGAMPMAAGGCRWLLSVHSQADTKHAELELERKELKADDRSEHKELMEIYAARGFDSALAKQVTEHLMLRDALGAHAHERIHRRSADTFSCDKTNAGGFFAAHQVARCDAQRGKEFDRRVYVACLRSKKS